ncbi:MAG: hypothetical protein IPO17_03985 [Flavobacteriales bacterium]|nr:hypothetical protein [Flavobacteriales bacterium]
MKHIASRLLWSLIPAALLSTVSLAQGTAINTTGAVAAPSAILDVASTTRGILIPRMIEAQRLAIPTLAANNGLWVYQIADPGNTTPNGLWYYDASAPNAGWYRMSTGNGWLLAGNSLTNPATNFLGTTDAQPLIFATQAVERMRLGGTTSFLGIANNNPVEALSVTGAIHMTTGGAPGSLTDQAGVLRYNTAPVLNAPYPAMVPQIPFHQGNTTGAATGWDRLENAFTEVHPAPYNGTQLLCGNGTMDVPNNGGISNVPTPTFSDTPYPTSNGRGSKRQYVFTGAELVGWGLCPGPITEVAFRITSDDIQLPAPASVQIQIRLSNVPVGTTLVGGFDRPTSALAAMGTTTTVVAAGVQPIAIAGFNWTGGDLLVDVCYTRAAQPGVSPTVQVNTGFANCTFYGHISTAVNGWQIDATVPATAPPIGFTSLNFPAAAPLSWMGATNERAVIRFTGQAQVPSPLLIPNGTYVHYTGGLLVGQAAWAVQPGIYRGPGVIRAQKGVFDGNAQLSDHVFDRYFDGAPRAEEAHLGKPMLPLAQLEGYLAEKRHLPSMPSRQEWETHGKQSLGELSTGLWGNR